MIEAFSFLIWFLSNCISRIAVRTYSRLSAVDYTILIYAYFEWSIRSFITAILNTLHLIIWERALLSRIFQALSIRFNYHKTWVLLFFLVIWIVMTVMIKLGILLCPNILVSHKLLSQLSYFHSLCHISICRRYSFRRESS